MDKVKTKIFTIISITIFLIISNNLKAQEKAFHIGLAGVFSNNWILNQNNFGTLDGFNNNFAKRSELDYAITFGGGAGIDVGYNISKRHGIQSGLYIIKQGQRYKDEIGQENYTTSPTSIDYIEVKRNVKLNYAKIPILYKFELVPKRRSMSKTVNYYLSVGPEIGFLFGVFEKVEIADANIQNNLSGVRESEKFRKIDAGLSINNGVQIRLNKNVYFNTGLHLYFGLIDINGKKIKDLEYFSKNDVKYKPSHNFNASINVGVHYLFVSKGYY